MGIDFDIIESEAPDRAIRSIEQVNALRPLNPADSMPVGEVLKRLRESVGNEAAVLGFKSGS